MSTKFNTNNNAPSRSNANRSPNKQPKKIKSYAAFPQCFGKKRFATQINEWHAIQIKNYGFIKYGV